MPRKRNPENRGLPMRWRFIRKSYYYQVPPGQESAWDGKKTFLLGKSLPEAYKKWADRIGTIDQAKTIGSLLDRYALQVIPKKAITTQTHNLIAIKPLRTAFSDMRLLDLRPMHVYQYIDKREAKISARREIEILSHAYTKAVEWGYIDRHPLIDQIRLTGEKPRDRYVTDFEIEECFSLKSKRKSGSVQSVQSYIRVKLLSALRRGDLLRLTLDNLKIDGIHVTPKKTSTSTGKRIIIEWSEELREAINSAIKSRPNSRSAFLFCNRKGESYINEKTGKAGGWDSLWRGFMKRLLTETKVQERFTEHDIRAKTGSDSKTLADASKILTHANTSITKRVYRRKPEIIKPLR